MIGKMLRRKPEERLTIAQLWEQPWIAAEHPERYQPAPAEPGIAVTKSVFAEMKRYGFSSIEVENRLSVGAIGPDTATFHLLVEKKLEEDLATARHAEIFKASQRLAELMGSPAAVRGPGTKRASNPWASPVPRRVLCGNRNGAGLGRLGQAGPAKPPGPPQLQENSDANACSKLESNLGVAEPKSKSAERAVSPVPTNNPETPCTPRTPGNFKCELGKERSGMRPGHQSNHVVALDLLSTDLDSGNRVRTPIRCGKATSGSSAKNEARAISHSARKSTRRVGLLARGQLHHGKRKVASRITSRNTLLAMRSGLRETKLTSTPARVRPKSGVHGTDDADGNTKPDAATIQSVAQIVRCKAPDDCDSRPEQNPKSSTQPSSARRTRAALGTPSGFRQLKSDNGMDGSNRLKDLSDLRKINSHGDRRRDELQTHFDKVAVDEADAPEAVSDTLCALT